MKRFWRIAGILALVGVLAVAVAGAAALAQEPQDEDAFPFNFREKLHEAIAKALGIGVEEYDAAVDRAQDEVLDEAVAEGWLTQEQADRMQDGMEQGFGSGMRGGFHGPRGGMSGAWQSPPGPMGGPENSLVAVAAEKLGMTESELLDELEEGKSIAEVANGKNVDPNTIADAFLAQHADWLAQAVENGRLTQQQADWMQQHMEEEIQEHLNGTLPSGGGPGGCPGHGGFGSGTMGPGRFWEYPGTSES